MYKIQKVFTPNTEHSQGANVQTLKLVTGKDLKKNKCQNPESPVYDFTQGFSRHTQFHFL